MRVWGGGTTSQDCADGCPRRRAGLPAGHRLTPEPFAPPTGSAVSSTSTDKLGERIVSTCGHAWVPVVTIVAERPDYAGAAGARDGRSGGRWEKGATDGHGSRHVGWATPPQCGLVRRA